MPGVTKEQIGRAKEWDLLSYLQAYEPQELRRCGGSEYRTVTHDSLKISNGKWHWHSRGIGGRTALDYLIKVRGMGFVPAVELLCGERGAAAWERPEPGQKERQQKPFSLPEENRCGKAMVSYLQKRGIDADIISQCIGEKILYESRRYQNCVFVGRDPEGKARYACLRGTHGDFKMDVDGSDKRYGFCLPASDQESPFLAVAESPIDALSLATLVKLSGGEPRDSHYLSLGGTGSRALMQFLHDHPHVIQISLCLDNDKAGLKGIERLTQEIQNNAELSGRVKLVYPNPPKLGKDYNEFLCIHVKAARTAQRQRDGAR